MSTSSGRLLSLTKNTYCSTFDISRYYSSHSLSHIPGPQSLPIIGTLYQYLPIVGNYSFDRLHWNGFKKYQRYGPVVREEITPDINIVWIFKPEDIEQMYKSEGRYPLRRSHLALEKCRLDRPDVYNSGGLLPTNGSEWARMRSIFQKGLSSPVDVQKFLKITDEVIQEWLEGLERIRHLENIDFLEELSRLFLELTCASTLDTRLYSFSDIEFEPNSKSTKLMEAALVTNSSILKTDNGPQFWRKFDTPMYKKLKKAQKFMEEVAVDLLTSKISNFNKKELNESLTLLETYLVSPKADIKDITGIVCDFLLAGIDTTAYTTSFLLYYLGKNPSAQNNLFEESRKLLPSPDSPVTPEVLREATYTKAFLKESLRLRPVSVGTGRIIQKEAIFSGYSIPAGTFVVTQNQISCRLEKYFANPNEFKPERWIREHPSYKKPHPYLSLPFGHGSRSCIARRLAEQNMQTLLLKLSRKYQVEWKGKSIDTRSLLINKPDGPILLNFKKRQS